MKKVPAVLIATLVGLAGCSSSGTSFKAEEEKQVNTATAKPAQGDKAEAKADNADMKAGASSEAGAEKPAQPETSAQPAKPEETAQPAAPVQPAQPEQPTAPVQPAKPEEPAPATSPSESEKESNVTTPEPQGLPLEDRKLQIVPSSEGGMVFRPVKDDSTGLVEYMSGPVHYNLSAKTMDNEELSKRSEPSGLFATGETIDPSAVRHLELTGSDGKVLGRFQFINQNYSSYGQFMAAFNAAPGAESAEDITPESLAFYVAQPTTIEQFNKQNGSAIYRGKILGYKDGPNSSTSHQQAVANVEFNVDFGEKTISGYIAGDQRFDGLVKYNWRYTDDDDRPTAKGKALSHVNLNLKPTPIVQLNNGTVGFGVHPDDAGLDDPRALTGTVTVMDGTKEQEITSYGGIFAGPDAQEVVGQVGGGEERLIFGATRGE